MRIMTWISALLLTALLAVPTLAGAGLPTVARLDVGSYQAQILGDSPRLHTGTNTITVVVANLPEGSAVSLRLVSPKGETVHVPLRPLRVIAGPQDDHGDKGTGKVDDHDNMGTGKVDDHDKSDGHGDDDHDEDAYQVRGKVRLGDTGTWTAVLTVDGISAEEPVEVVQGGANRIFLGVSGTVMGAFLIYGAIERRRHPRKGV